MVIRFLHLGRAASAVEAQSPYAKIFFDFNNTKTNKSGYQVFVQDFFKENPSGSGKGGAGIALKSAAEAWKKVPEVNRKKYNEISKAHNEKQISQLLNIHVSDQVFTAVYKNDFNNVKKAVKKLQMKCIDMTKKENKDFCLAVERMYNLKRDSISNPSAHWTKTTRKNKAEYMKLTAQEKKQISAQFIAEYRMYYDQLVAAFPEHEIPVFLSLEAKETDEKYKQDIKIYRSIKRDLKVLKTQENMAANIKKRVKKEVSAMQMEARKKHGFIQGSEKRQLSGYFLFSQELRNKSSKREKMISLAECGAKWKSLSDKEKEVWNAKSTTEAKRSAIMNKGSLQRAIKAGDYIALAKHEVTNLTDEDKDEHSKAFKMARIEILTQIKNELIQEREKATGKKS